MKIKNDKEIIVGKTRAGKFEKTGKFEKSREVPFFVKNIEQICFSPCEDSEYKYSVSIITALSDKTESLFITKEQYDYLQEKLGANDDE